MEKLPTNQTADARQSEGNQNVPAQQEGQSAIPPAYSAYRQVYAGQPPEYSANAGPYQPAGFQPGYLNQVTAPVPVHASFQPMAADQRSARVRVAKARCMKVMVSLGLMLMIGAISFYSRAVRDNQYETDPDPSSVFRVIPIVFASFGLAFLSIGLGGILIMYLGEKTRREEGYDTLSNTGSLSNLPIYPLPNQGVQSVPGQFVQPPSEAPGVSLYPRQQYA